jgi:hypothetical protein
MSIKREESRYRTESKKDKNRAKAICFSFFCAFKLNNFLSIYFSIFFKENKRICLGGERERGTEKKKKKTDPVT